MQYTIENMDFITQKFTFSYSDFADEAATSKVFGIPTQGDNVYLVAIGGKVNTAFVTGTAPQIKIGFSGYDDYLMPLQRLNQTGKLLSGKPHQTFCIGMDLYPVSKEIQMTVQNTSGNLSAYTAGEFEIVLVYAADKI